MRPQTSESFWQKVDKRGPDECWPWLRSLTGNGYGSVKVCGRVLYAHRHAYELIVGPIPEGLTLDHLCRNRACCNPSHLEPVTQKVNVHRGNGPAGVNARMTRCSKGHEFSIARDGRRYCRICKAYRARSS